MGDGRPQVAILSGTWFEVHSESAFVLRSLGAAMARHADVDVLTPGTAGTVRADGAFDVTAIGESLPGRWPTSDAALVAPSNHYDLAVAEGGDAAAVEAISWLAPPHRRVSVVAGSPSPNAAGTTAWKVGLSGPPEGRIGLHVPIHPMARVRSHVGLGFTGYLLVLSDRSGTDVDTATPTSCAAWLAARFPDRHLVIVENGVASVWRWRSLRGLVEINTRADLWRLLAHARLTVDLAPGPLIARECVESLRYGVPIVVPTGTAAENLAGAGGGLWFRHPAELLACVDILDDDDVRHALGREGQAVADRWYGDPFHFSERVSTAMTQGLPR